MAKAQGRHADQDREDGLREKMIAVNRVSKVVKGSRTMSFAALAAVGDGDGRVGMGKGKAREVPTAVQKAMEQERVGLCDVPLTNGTLHDEVIAGHGSSNVLIAHAIDGIGLIAGGTMRAVFEALGVRDVVAKSIGSNNPSNLVHATLNGLASCNAPSEIAAKRGKPVEELMG